MTIPALLSLAAIGAVVFPLCWLLTKLSRYGIVGCLYLISAWLHAWGDTLRAHTAIAAAYRRQALNAIPRPVIDIPVRRRTRKSSLMQRARKMLATLRTSPVPASSSSAGAGRFSLQEEG